MNTAFILDFLGELAQNNQKAWFDENRKTYEKAKKTFEGQVSNLLHELQGFDEGLIGLEAKKCIFRINRDVRFSKDKSPYKNNFGAFFQKGGKKAVGAGYYFHLQPNESFVAGGIYMPQPAELAKIRQEIDYNLTEFKAIIENDAFAQCFGALEGEKMKGVPRGYTADNPALAFLQYKSFTVWHKLTDEMLRQDAWHDTVVSAFQTLKPFNDFLNRAVE